jgi:hypothetical protein
MSMNYLYAQMQAKGREVLTTTAPDREKMKILPKLLGEPRERGKEEVTKIHGEPGRGAGENGGWGEDSDGRRPRGRRRSVAPRGGEVVGGGLVGRGVGK